MLRTNDPDAFDVEIDHAERMDLQPEREEVARYCPSDLSAFEKLIPMEWIEQALELHGVTRSRRRRLPAELVVWLVIGTALMSGRGIGHVLDAFGLGLPEQDGKRVAESAIRQARKRVKSGPLK